MNRYSLFLTFLFSFAGSSTTKLLNWITNAKFIYARSNYANENLRLISQKKQQQSNIGFSCALLTRKLSNGWGNLYTEIRYFRKVTQTWRCFHTIGGKTFKNVYLEKQHQLFCSLVCSESLHERSKAYSKSKGLLIAVTHST